MTLVWLKVTSSSSFLFAVLVILFLLLIPNFMNSDLNKGRALVAAFCSEHSWDWRRSLPAIATSRSRLWVAPTVWSICSSRVSLNAGLSSHSGVSEHFWHLVKQHVPDRTRGWLRRDGRHARARGQ